MAKRKIKTFELGTVPLLVRIGEASRLFGIGRPQLMGMVKSGKVKTVRLNPRGQHRFPVYELASALGMADMCPRVGIPIDKDLLRNLDEQVAESVEKARVVFQSELKAQIASLRHDLWEMVKAQDRPPTQPAVNKPLKGWQAQSGGGSY
jgi:hypothetical protein